MKNKIKFFVFLLFVQILFVACPTYSYANEYISITSQPREYTGKAGGLYTVTVGASGNGLKYQWETSTDGGKSWTNSEYGGNNSSSMSLYAKEERNGHKYRCKVSDAAGNTAYSNTVTLNLVKINITSQPKEYTGKVGGLYTVTVGASGNRLKYQWETSTDGGKSWINSEYGGNNSSSMSLYAKEERNGHKFRCKVSDTAGNTAYSNTVTLNLAKINITSQPKEYTGKVGGLYTVAVVASGNGLKYQWETSTDGGKSWTNSEYGGNNSSSMSLYAKEERNGHKFRCKVSDAAGNTAYSNTVTLNLTKINITIQPKEYTGKAGGLYTVTVVASGNGLKYQWETSTDGGKNWTNSTFGGNNSSSMSLYAKEERNGHKFRCKVSDTAGNTVYSDIVTLVIFERDDWELPIM